jgi:hypothetical protein
MRPKSACSGLIKTLFSMRATTLGTIRIAERFSRTQAWPNLRAAAQSCASQPGWWWTPKTS